MGCHSEDGVPIDSFALVAYIPDPLGSFLDRLRQELVASCHAQSHLTLLPPRSLAIGPEGAKRKLTDELQDFAPFSVELTGIRVFEATGVIYLGIGTGMTELREIHDRLSATPHLGCAESHEYHPHVTLAQDFPPQELNDVERLASERWAAFKSRRSFNLECLTFVQNTTVNRWIDLADFQLGEPVLSSTC
jgi:2'-5' RNA ligase